MFESELFYYLATFTTFTKAREGAWEISSLAQLVPGTAARWPPEGELRVLKRFIFFPPEYYCLPNRLPDGIKTNLLLFKTESKNDKDRVSRRDWGTSLRILSHTNNIDRLVDKVS